MRFALSFVRPIVVLWVALTLVFVALRLLPGQALVSSSALVSDEDFARRREQLGLDDPPLTQYMHYWQDILSGNWGESLVSREPVSQLIQTQMDASFSLGMGALGIALIFGFLFGIISSGHGILAWLSNIIILIGQSVPIYISALLAIYIFSLRLQWLPASGSATIKHLVLPCSILGLQSASSIAIVLRANLKEVLQSPAILTAKAKGLDPIDILDHSLRIAILPTLNIIALQAGFLLTGTVIIETLFVRRGLGALLLDSVLNRDYPVVQALTLISTLIYLVATLFSEHLQHMMDPRPR